MADDGRNDAEATLAAYALGALEQDEQILAAKLAGEASYRELWGDFQGAVAGLAANHVPEYPPAALKRRLLASLDQHRQYAGRHRLRRWTMPAIGAAALLLSLVGLAASSMVQQGRVESLESHVAKLEEEVQLAEQNLRAQRELVYWSVSSERAAAVQPVETLATAVSEVAMASAPRGMLFIPRHSDQAILAIINMEPLGEGLIYQVWLWDDLGNAYSLSTFGVDEEGYAHVPLTLPTNAIGIEGLSISVEPGGGSARPVGQHILAGDVQLPTR